MGVEAQCREGEAGGNGCEVGYSWTLRMVCYYLRVTRNRNVVLLVKLKDVLGVLDGDRVLGKVESIAE